MEKESDGMVFNTGAALLDEQDNFNYSIDCGIGEVILGGDSYSSLGVSREIDNDAEKKMELHCGVGQIHVEYR